MGNILRQTAVLFGLCIMRMGHISSSFFGLSEKQHA